MHKEPSNFAHSDIPQTGVLITNLGTPDDCTPQAVKRYLKEFLWDPRVVEIPRPIWWLILNGLILNTRPAKSAEAYKKVWTDEGSPLLSISKSQKKALQLSLDKQFKGPIKVALGMRYGNPSIKSALDELRKANVQRIIVLPLYPQHAAASTASTFDAVAETLKDWRYVPEIRFISHYHDNEGYITATANSIQDYWDDHGKPDKLVFSFHGMPKRTLAAGDPYFCQCQKTARLVMEKLGLSENDAIVSFQSRFGKEEWLKPYASETLEQLGKQGIKSVDVVCPGFSADCLETLEEMAVENREIFEKAYSERDNIEKGAESGQYRYIPALNDNAEHINVLTQLILYNMQGWPGLDGWNSDEAALSANSSANRAKSLGAIK